MVNEKYLKLCSPSPYNVIIKPLVDNISFNDGEVWFDVNNICWEVLSGETGHTVTTSYDNWGTFTKHTNNDCLDCVEKRTNLIPRFPFTHQLSYNESYDDCLKNCGPKEDKKSNPFQCPPGVITKFPLTAECVIANPSSYDVNDGQICLTINGGTKPYSIMWSGTNQNGFCLSNLSGGSYTATITDFYGDYTILKTCELSIPPNNEICFTYKSVECDSSTPLITSKYKPKGVINNKPYYQINGFFVYYTGERWEYRTEIYVGELLSILPLESDLPIGDQWSGSSIALSSLECFDTEICVYIKTQPNISGGMNDYVKFKPDCILENKIYYTINGVFAIRYDINDNKWFLVSTGPTEVIYGSLNNNGILPIENYSGSSYDWNILNNDIIEISTLSGECPTIITYPNLCVTIDCVKNNYIYSGLFNQKPTWISELNPISQIKYQNSYWSLTNYGYNIKSDTNETIPLSGWERLGGNSTITVVTGECSTNLEFSVQTEKPTCVNINDGSITININCPQIGETYLYSYDGGINYSQSSVSNNLTNGTYSVCVKSNSQGPICKTNVVVPPANPKENYTLELNIGDVIEKFLSGNTYVKYTPFNLVVRDSQNQIINSLPTGTQITFDLSVGDSYKLYDPHPPTPINEYYLELNNTEIIGMFVFEDGVFYEPNTDPNCEELGFYNGGQGNYYTNITISNNFSLSGYVKNIFVIDNMSIYDDDDYSCVSKNSIFNTTNLFLNNLNSICPCCDTQFIGDTITWDTEFGIETYLKFAEAVGLTQTPPVF